MSPFIRDGDAITVSPVPPGHPAPGDVVAFHHPETGRLVVHRVVAVSNGSFILRGDNAEKTDGVVPEDGIIGLVTCVERGGRRLGTGTCSWRRIIAFLSRHSLLRQITRAEHMFRSSCGKVGLHVQGSAAYRRTMRTVTRKWDLVTVKEDLLSPKIFARGGETPQVDSHTVPFGLIRFTAAIGAKEIGSIDLATYPASAGPYAGTWISSLGVTVPCRGMGVGELLVRHALVRVQKEGAKGVSLLVENSNEPAIRLYRKLKFEMTTCPGLEDTLEREYRETGKRRVTMHFSCIKDGQEGPQQ
jgi:ribosomal protein S18 acetylase RimI-like enzyme